MQRRAGADGRGRPVQPADRDVQRSTARRSGRRTCRSTRPPSPAPCSCWATASCASASTPAWAAWTTRASLTKVAELLQAPVATSVSRQGRHRRVPSAGRRLGLRAAGHAHRREGLQGTSIWCWPSACATARCPPASTPIPPHRRVIHVDANAEQPRPDRQDRRSASTPTPASSSTACWTTPTRCAGPPTPRWPARIRQWKCDGGQAERRSRYARCGVDPMLFLLALRQCDAARRAAVRGRDLRGALGGRGVHASAAAHLLQPDRQPGDGLVDPGGASGRSASTPAGRR